jgi:outer membrane protein assembly factor BamB
VFNHQGKDSYLLGVNRRDGRTVWKTDRSRFQYGWSTPVHWRHDGVEEIVVLGGDFEPDQRLMAYNLADGAERWWTGGLPPCGKSTPVIGDGLVFLAAPDIILETAAGESEFGGEGGADQHGQHASTDFLKEFATMPLRHGTPPHGSGDGNLWPILPRTWICYRTRT